MILIPLIRILQTPAEGLDSKTNCSCSSLYGTGPIVKKSIISPVGEINAVSKSSAKSFQSVIYIEGSPEITVKYISRVCPVFTVPS